MFFCFLSSPHTRQLSAKRFVNVRMFNGRYLVDIREYYIDDAGERKPGRKGGSCHCVCGNPSLHTSTSTSVLTEVNRSNGTIKLSCAGSIFINSRFRGQSSWSGCYVPYFLDYFLRVLLISDHTYPWVQYEGGYKTRVGSFNFSLVWRALQSLMRHQSAHEWRLCTAQILGTYSAVQCMSTNQLDKRSESS